MKTWTEFLGEQTTVAEAPEVEERKSFQQFLEERRESLKSGKAESDK